MNVLKQHLQSAIFTLLERGVSQRRIHELTGIDRKTIRRYQALHKAQGHGRKLLRLRDHRLRRPGGRAKSPTAKSSTAATTGFWQRAAPFLQLRAFGQRTLSGVDRTAGAAQA